MAETTEKVWVRDLAVGQLVDTTFAVLRKERRRARNGSPFLSLDLADRTGRVRATLFDDVPLLDGRFAEGDTVRVLGTVEEYRGKPQLLVRAVEKVSVGDPLDYVPGARRDTEDLDGYLDFLAEEIGDSTLKALVLAVHGDPAFRARFRNAPMTIDGHHSYAGGALQHTVAVASLCREAGQLHVRLDGGTLTAAALLFAAGAADAFLPGATLQLSEEGRLLGIGHLAARRVERHAQRLGTQRSRLVPLLHCIEATRPRTPEAACLQAAIALDATVVEALRAAGSPGAVA